MIHRVTSQAAYDKIKADGTLSRQRWRTYDYLFHHGPCTAGEVTFALKSPKEVHPSYHRRLDELGDLGVAKRIRIRTCSVTGEQAYEWDVTANLPVGTIKHRKTRPSAVVLKKAAAQLRAMCPLSAELRELEEWLRQLAPDDPDPNLGPLFGGLLS